MEPNQPYQDHYTSPPPTLAQTMPAPKKKNRTLKIALIVFGVVAVLCLSGVVAIGVSFGNHTNKAATLPLIATTPDPTPAETTPSADPPTTAPTTRLTTPPATKPAAAAPVRISGDDIVLVGTDVPAGTYRATTKVDPEDGCYWEKSKDAEGDDIIDNANVSGGRPQVTLKKGQWFTSEDCPDWTKQK